MTRRVDLPRAEELPIPADVQPGPGWTEQMLEMAAHVGAFDTLAIVAALGGQSIYIPRDKAKSPFAEIVGEAAVATLAWVYGGHHYAVPVGRAALARARRAPVLAAVRAKRMTTADAARLLGTSRTYLAHLANQTDEGAAATPIQLSRKRDTRQIELFSDD